MKLMLTPTSGVPSEVTTCPRMTQAWLRRQGSEREKEDSGTVTPGGSLLCENTHNEKRKISNRNSCKREKKKNESKFDLNSLDLCCFFPLPSGLSASLRYANEA